jgi:beta-mannosidase
MARIRGASGLVTEELTSGWQLCEGPAKGGPSTPAELETYSARWIEAQVPGTVASALTRAGAFNLLAPRDFDDADFWYRTRFASAPAESGESLWLHFEGLATLCEVWLNGERLFASDNMFQEHAVDVSALVRPENELLLRFSALTTALAKRRPRPRYRTRLVDRPQLRWFRTTLIGRIPAWSPPVAPVGPYRAIRLERRRGPWLGECSLRATVDGARRLVGINARITAEHANLVTRAWLSVAGSRVELDVSGIADGRLEGTLAVADAELWWPHTHGRSPRYEASLELEGAAGTFRFDLGQVAFRTVEALTSDGRFTLLVNGTEVFCRGACWTTDDLLTLGASAAPTLALAQARHAGMNMLRLIGTMHYESDAFYEACDDAGILVWQDYMFANFDYPNDDADFVSSVRREAEQFLARTETRACLAVLCGSSEVEQQAAMLGLPADAWKQPLFETVLREISQEWRSDVPYVSSSPTGGDLPFQVNSGVSHYYGVGAYLRPLEDARRANLRFTTECLGFANIPEDSTIEALLSDGQAPFHHPLWKARVPRDGGPGWDFDDVRDHYTRLLFGVDPSALRYADPARAISLGRLTTGEVMAAAVSEWRRAGSSCRGALIWLMKDLWPGAGWGLIDSTGLPKAVYYFVRRAMQPIAVFLSDEGLNGLSLQLVNDSERSLSVNLSLVLLRNERGTAAEGSLSGVTVPARAALEIPSSRLFEHFLDTTYAYRFGPRSHHVAVASMTDAESGELLGRWFHFAEGTDVGYSEDLKLDAVLEPVAPGQFALTVSANKFARAVAIDVRGFELEDDYFNLLPDESRRVLLKSADPAAKPKGFVQAINQRSPTRIDVRAPNPPA